MSSENDKSRTNRRDIKIPLRDLRIGMFVSGLDRDWLETPFLMQGFYIRNQDDIRRVGEYCNHVYVLGSGKFRPSELVDLDSGELIGRKPEKYPIETPIWEEHKRVNELASEARSYVKTLFHNVRFGEALDTRSARKLVQDSVDSIVRHPDANALMTKLRGQDEYTVEHSLNVCVLSIVFGRRLGLRRNQLINLGLCGLLHDVGKIKIPDEILHKPGPLTKAEFEIMKQHAALGRDYLLEKKDIYQDAVEVAYSHHERPDGHGYPRGIVASEISMFAKIVSIVDAYDAITGDRVYAKGRPTTEALRIIYEGRGKQFDAQFALAFIQTIGVYPPGSVVELVNGMVAVVIENSRGMKHLPKILIVRDEKKELCKERFLDLSTLVDENQSRQFLIKSALTDGCYGISLADLRDREIFEQLSQLQGVTLD